MGAWKTGAARPPLWPLLESGIIDRRITIVWGGDNCKIRFDIYCYDRLSFVIWWRKELDKFTFSTWESFYSIMDALKLCYGSKKNYIKKVFSIQYSFMF